MILPFFSGKRLASFLGLAVLFIALRWNNFDTPLIRDEGEYAYSAQLLKHGQLPYEHAFLQKPPMVAYSYALAQMFAPHAFWAPRILAYVFVAAATALLGYAVRLEFGKRVAWMAMWLFTPMVLLPGIQQFTANTEMFMVLPLMATVAISVAGRQGRGGGWAWFCAGACAAVTFWYKYTALPLLAAIVGGWLFAEWRRGRRGWRLGRLAAFGLAGAGVASVVVLGPFLVSDGGRHLWECTVEFNRTYASTSTFGVEPLGLTLKMFWKDWWILFVLPLALAWPFTRGGGRASPAPTRGGPNPVPGRARPPPPQGFFVAQILWVLV
jgi:hypothetical protein